MRGTLHNRLLYGWHSLSPFNDSPRNLHLLAKKLCVAVLEVVILGHKCNYEGRVPDDSKIAKYSQLASVQVPLRRPRLLGHSRIYADLDP